MFGNPPRWWRRAHRNLTRPRCIQDAHYWGYFGQVGGWQLHSIVLTVNPRAKWGDVMATVKQAEQEAGVRLTIVNRSAGS